MESNKSNFLKKPTLTERAQELFSEAKWFFYAILALVLFAMLFSFSPSDSSFNHFVSYEAPVKNWVGSLGAWVADALLYIFGHAAYWFALMFAWLVFTGWRNFLKQSLTKNNPLTDEQVEEQKRDLWLSRAGFCLLIVATMGLETKVVKPLPSLPYHPGGVLGEFISLVLTSVFGTLLTTILLLFVFLVGLSWFFNFSWLQVCERVGAFLEQGLLKILDYAELKKNEKEIQEYVQHREDEVVIEQRRVETAPPIIIERPAPIPEQSVRVIAEKQAPLFTNTDQQTQLPEVSLLDAAQVFSDPVSVETLEFNSRMIETKLRDFGVHVTVVAALPGPVVTRYEIEPATGVKGSQIVNLAKDLARSLSLVSIRVVETIPGKNYMALELPNPKRQIVRLSEIIGSKMYHEAPSKLTVALGKDISGHPVIADLAKMPHLLVAGTTGSGKSVGINTMILSLLYKAMPDEVRLILIDPKMLEMSVYEGIPHLLCPVVTDMKQAGLALNWAVGEMEKRYKLMSKMGVRNLAGFNKKVEDANAAGESLPNPFSLTPDMPEPLETLPTIVIVIDELADLMMVVGKKVEELIARIAQKARAAGIHLILATQRPSVDVITGLIKANVPTRIAFQVSSKIDSRTILDQQGAEALLGQGDMLYLPPGSGFPVRVHGAFASDEEVIRVVEKLKTLAAPNYLDEILTGGSVDGEMGEEDAEKEPEYDLAVEFVLTSKQTSISAIQRKLRIGYNKAARIVEQMENAGILSAPGHNGQRELLVRDHLE